MKKFFIFAAAAIAMAACSNDDNEVIAQNDNAIHLSANVGNRLTRANAADGLQETQFESGQNIFVEAYKTGESSTYTTATYQTTDANGAMTGEMYYPSDGSNIDICAFYPSTVSSATTSFSVNASQTTANVANYRGSDLMYATKLTNEAKKTTGTHALTFNHALSKIIVTLAAGNGVTADDIAGKVTAVKINNTKPTAEFTITNGAPGAITASGTAADIDITGATKADHAGIIVPQEVAAGEFITVTYNGNNYTYLLAAATTFEAGKVYTYALTLSTAGISLSSASITNWTEGTGGSGTITL